MEIDVDRQCCGIWWLGAEEVTEFRQSMRAVGEYQVLANFILEIMAIPQSTAGVERTSKVNNNKT